MNARHRRRVTGAGWRRRSGVALVAAGLATIGGGTASLVSAHASVPPGSNFGSVDITATATGLRSPMYSHNGEDVEAQAPYAFADMQSGGTSHALTSVFWPGGTGGNGGSTLYLLTGSCLPPRPGNIVPIPGLPDPPCLTTVPQFPDPVYKALNDSYKAEAQSGTGNPTDKQANPGVDMEATATSAKSAASTTMAGGALPTGDTFGATQTVSTISFTGPNTAVVDALSVVRNISLGGGALTIDAVKSVAHAVTDGKKATGTANTVIYGMKIAGQPVTVDDHGISVAGHGTALPSLAALNNALAKSGIQVYLAQPTRKVKGASADLFSGQLILSFGNSQYTSNANDTGIVLSLGGASIAASASPGYNFSLGAPPPASTSAAAPPATGNVPAAGSTGPATGGITPPGPSVAGSPAPASPPVLAANRLPLPGGIAPGLVVVLLLGAGLIAIGLTRLPAHVLATGATACPLAEQA